jgi:hypothetical protein
LKNNMEDENKKMTIEDLSLIVKDGFKKIDGKFKETNKKIDEKNDELAGMTQNQFLESRVHMDKRFDKVDDNIKEIKADLNKKADVFAHNDLTYRVEKVEEKIKKHEIIFQTPAKGVA